MTRRTKCICYLVFCLLAACFLFYPRSYYHDPIDVFYASEKGMQLGPSETIKDMLPLGDDTIGIVGLWDGGLSVVETQRKNPFFWGLANCISGYQEAPFTVNCYVMDGGYLYGLVKDASITTLQVSVESDQWLPEGAAQTDAAEVATESGRKSFTIEEFDADGYFSIPLPPIQVGEIGWHDCTVCYLEARNAQGEILWQEGIDQDGTEYPRAADYPDYAAQKVNAYLASLA